jgi:uncharacterized membrane protein YkvA (DUF1232 family)
MIACWLFLVGRFARLTAYRCALEAAIFLRAVVLSPACPASKIALIIGIGYWFGPVDLIPNHLPYIGYLDQVTVLLAGLLAARYFVPARRAAGIRARRPPPVFARPFTIVFCHCPKTAGTSLFRALSDRLGYRASYLMRRQRPDLARLRRRGFAFISGHAPYGHYRDAGAVDGTTRFVTFYREPRAVLLSRFAHVLRHRRDNPAARHFFEVELPSRGLAMTSPEAVPLFLQRHRAFDASEADNPQTRFAANCPAGPLDESHLEQAKATFAAMDVVGCTERFEESLMLLAQCFGWTELSYHRLNVSHPRQRAGEDPALLAELDRHLSFDHRLIAWAADRFEQQIAVLRAASLAGGTRLPLIRLLEAEPPYRAWRHRLSAATTMLTDDWLWWLGAKREAWRRQIAESVGAVTLSRKARGGDPGRP